MMMWSTSLLVLLLLRGVESQECNESTTMESLAASDIAVLAYPWAPVDTASGSFREFRVYVTNVFKGTSIWENTFVSVRINSDILPCGWQPRDSFEELSELDRGFYPLRNHTPHLLFLEELNSTSQTFLIPYRSASRRWALVKGDDQVALYRSLSNQGSLNKQGTGCSPGSPKRKTRPNKSSGTGKSTPGQARKRGTRKASPKRTPKRKGQKPTSKRSRKRKNRKPPPRQTPKHKGRKPTSKPRGKRKTRKTTQKSTGKRRTRKSKPRGRGKRRNQTPTRRPRPKVVEQEPLPPPLLPSPLHD